MGYQMGSLLKIKFSICVSIPQPQCSKDWGVRLFGGKINNTYQCPNVGIGLLV